MSFPGQHVQRAWHLIDASNQRVGRVAAQIALLLKGKHKPTYRPNADIGDYVVVVNAEKVQFSGKKWKDKLYRWHTGYPGGLKERRAMDQLHRHPTSVLRKAVLGMLRRNNLRHGYIEPRLKIYEGPDHPHVGQLPTATTSPRPGMGTSRDGKVSDWGLQGQPYAQQNPKLALKLGSGFYPKGTRT